MALNSGNSCPDIFSAWGFTCWGDKLRIFFTLLAKRCEIHTVKPQLYDALTIPRPPLL